MQRARIAALTLAVAAAIPFSSCGDSTPVAPPAHDSTFTIGTMASAAASIATTSASLVQCSELSPATVKVTVGRNGGVVIAGPFALAIPAGALSGAVEIKAKVVPGRVNRVHFEPEGLTFKKPAVLAMGYTNCGLSVSAPALRIAYVDDALNVLEYLPSYDSKQTKTVFGLLEHFSDYVIAW